MARIVLDDVSVEYPIYSAGAFSLRSRLIAIGTGGRISNVSRHIRTVAALDGLNLKFKDGDRVGLVGHNGSGKSTLLRTIAGIFTPTRGKVTTEGRISTVFELGAGLQRELSGYDNIIRMSMMLGTTRAEAEASIPDIEAFTELGNFLAMPVHTYSSGMSTRLIFAVATSTSPEILLVDEVFAAGDADFQERARRRMTAFVEKANILVLATHSDTVVESLCNRQIRLEHGLLSSDEAISGPENSEAAVEC